MPENNKIDVSEDFQMKFLMLEIKRRLVNFKDVEITC